MDGLWEAGSRGRRARASLVVLAAAASLAACAAPRYATREAGQGGLGDAAPPPPGLHGTDKPYQINGRWYYPKAQPGYDEVGLASWYGAGEHNRHTANGEVFNQYGLSAAHKTLPLPSIVEVTNLANGRRLRVRLNDRGPFIDGRLIDLSRGAAEKLGFDRAGVAKVRVRYIGAAPPLTAEGVTEAALSPRRAVIEAPVAAPVLSASLDSSANLSSGAAEPEIGDDYRVQVGAFPTRDEARRAATRLGEGTRYVIEPMARGGATLYRVVLGGYPDEDDALAAQLRIAEAGFADARVLKPF